MPRLSRTKLLKKWKRLSRRAVPSREGKIEELKLKYVRAREKRKWTNQSSEGKEVPKHDATKE